MALSGIEKDVLRRVVWSLWIDRRRGAQSGAAAARASSKVDASKNLKQLKIKRMHFDCVIYRENSVRHHSALQTFIIID